MHRSFSGTYIKGTNSGLEKVSLYRGFPLVKITYGKVTPVDIQVTVLLKNVSYEVVTLPKG